MNKKEAALSHKIVRGLSKPQVICRWIKRYGIVQLTKQISRLPFEVRKLGKRYVKIPNIFVVY